MSNRIAVIGLGNTFRRDDGIGVAVLDALVENHKRKDVDYLNFGTASFDILHRIRDYAAVLIVDGIDASLKPGELEIFKLPEVEYHIKNSHASSHEFGLKNILEFYKKLDIKTKIYIAGIQVKDASYGEGLTRSLKNNKKKFVEEISSFIDRTLV